MGRGAACRDGAEHAHDCEELKLILDEGKQLGTERF